MSLPQINTTQFEAGFYMSKKIRGLNIGLISGVIAAAAKRNKIKYNTKTTRAVRMRMAEQMVKSVESFNELSDVELRAMSLACASDVDGIAQWLKGQDFQGTAIEAAPSYDDLYEGPPMDGDHWGDSG